jgi:integrase
MSLRNDKGIGTKYYDKKLQRYIYQFWYQTPDGQRKRKKLVAKTKKALNEKVSAWQMNLKEGVITADTEMSVDDLANIWLAAIRTSLKPNTYNLYRNVIHGYVIPKYGTQKLHKIQAFNVQIWLNSLYKKPSKNTEALSATTINKIRNTWRTMMAYAVKNGMLDRNPLDQVKQIREDRKSPMALNESQLNHLLAVAKSGEYYPGEDNFARYLKREAYVAVTLAARTGMRRGEIFGLDWQSIHFDDSLLTVNYTLLANRKRNSPKTTTSCRNILLDEDTMRILEDWSEYQKSFERRYGGIYVNRQNLVFTTIKGTPVSMDNFRKRHWAAMCRAAGIPDFGFHGLRHCHATLLLKAGVNVKVVAERLGHADVAITMRTYAHVLPTMQQSAVKAITSMVDNAAINKRSLDSAGTPSGDAGENNPSRSNRLPHSTISGKEGKHHGN